MVGLANGLGLLTVGLANGWVGLANGLGLLSVGLGWLTVWVY